MHVRQVQADDIDGAVATLVESHVDYVWEAWALPFGDRADRLARLFRADLEVIAFPHGEVWATDDLASVAVWLPAGAHQRVSRRRRRALDEVASAELGDRAATVDEVGAVIEAAGPACEWYLATMGTRSDRRRAGLGTAVLAPVLHRLDEDREAARLDTSDPTNVRFYRRLGFEVVAEVRPPHDAPITWVMVRSKD